MNNIFENFDKYVKNYDKNNNKIKLKYDHTYRVVGYAKRIAESENLNEHDYNLAVTCALLHDIARFKQATDYNTFCDSLSFDHGDTGYEILKENDYVSNYCDNDIDKNIILKSVKNHNKKEIEDNVTDKELYFCKLVRDADKLDIIFSLISDITDNSNTINENAIKEIKEKKLCSNKYANNECESIIRYLAFIFDLNFNISYKIISDSDIVNKKIDLLSKYVKNVNLEEIREILNNYIKEKDQLF